MPSAVDQLQLPAPDTIFEVAMGDEQHPPIGHLADDSLPAILAPDKAVLPEEEPSATVQHGTIHDNMIIPPPTSISPPPSLTNFSQELLTPWSCMGMKIFVDICSGADKPLTTAVEARGLPALAIDLLVDPRMDLLDDSFYEQLLRLCGSGVVGYTGAAPSCTEYSLLKLRPGGPRAIRTPEMMDGVPGLTISEQQRLQDSAQLLDRCTQATTCTFTAGGHGHIEQPSGAMSWREECTRQWIRLSNSALVLLAACSFGWDIKKTWLMASSFQPLSSIASTCNHSASAHQSIAGVRDEHGIYLSRRSAAYPASLAEAFADKISVLLSPTKQSLSWDNIFELFPKKDWFQDPKSFVDGGGLISTPDWSRPPHSAENVFMSIRNHWIPKILDKRLHHQIVGHFQQRKVDPPFPESLVQEFRESLDRLLPLQEPLDWQVRPDQPLCLHALAAVSTYMKDPDTALFPSLIEGVSTGFRDQIPPSNVFSKKQDLTEPDRPELSIHWSNWQTSESQPELTSELVQEEIDKGWLICFPGSLSEAQAQFPVEVAVGKLAIATSESRPPRLVVDFTVSGTNHNCDIPEHQQLPSAKDVVRSYPLRGHTEELGALGLDVKSAHKLCVLHPSHRGLVGFSFQGKLYFYKVCPFGEKFSAWWWGRLGSFFTRFFYQLIFIAHALFLFVEDYLLIQRMDILPITAALISLVVQAFRLPISWRKADLHREVSWIGWTFNFSAGLVKLQQSKREKLLKQIQDLLQRPKTSRKAIEKFLGLALWVTQLFPTMRAFLSYIICMLTCTRLLVLHTQWIRVSG